MIKQSHHSDWMSKQKHAMHHETAHAFISAIMLHEGVGYGFHAVNGTDHNHRRPTTHHQSESSRVVGELVRVVGVSQELRGVVDDQVQERVVTFEDACGLTTTLELDANGFVQVLGEVDDALFPLLFFLSGVGRCRCHD